jgi:glycosyltransferase involved in cell wall biosynthesis
MNNTNYPKITIVTPSYNQGMYLERTILSIIEQNYPNLEYIIIDGGSTDDSVEIIKKYEKYLTYWVSEKDKGHYHAVQKGFEKSTGEIMGWLNSDDMLQTHSLFTIGQVFGDFQQIQWLQGFPNVIDEYNRVVYTRSGKELTKSFFYQKKHLTTGMYIQQESTYWRRSLWEKAGSKISQNYKYAGDFELWIRFFQYEKLHNIDAMLGSFRLRQEGQASANHYNEYVAETLAVLESYPLSPIVCKELEKNILYEQLKVKINTVLLRIFRRFIHHDNSVIPNTLDFNTKTQKFLYRNV